ncbi:hypothetical protein FAZ19_12410 [Sphingobacterium alkalisoli]|uniref:Late embryogenesis abundant protein LEA-2 subgroup domain-containing protein n=1 Tax=Sphingobacterium alkalisoli TaxID=1874115 RepID=A0A4U0H407_9SPHI|nr:hypothetical protein [Sphingobacterium alkalisoli]TJY65904.1 hypothetical protein FAZ19_12410 [Sphingobacterium alkalisoli]GGH17570.1 hypothetical protein GCM10011418_20590 [Sphingobacterium alkalisoli]
MKRISLISIIVVITFVITGCVASKRAQLEALAKCTYDVQSINNMLVGGKSVESFDTGNGINIASIPSIALAILRKDLPLEANVNLKIMNPSPTVAAINQFKYLIEIQGNPVFEGTVDQNIHLSTNESSVVPLSFKLNLFGADKKDNYVEKIFDELFKREKSDNFMTLKIKPSFRIGGNNIYYPTYITVDTNLLKKLKI